MPLRCAGPPGRCAGLAYPPAAPGGPHARAAGPGLALAYTTCEPLFSFSRNAYDIPRVPASPRRLAQFTTTLGVFVMAVASMAHPGHSLPWPVVRLFSPLRC